MFALQKSLSSVPCRGDRVHVVTQSWCARRPKTTMRSRVRVIVLIRLLLGRSLFTKAIALTECFCSCRKDSLLFHDSHVDVFTRLWFMYFLYTNALIEIRRETGRMGMCQAWFWREVGVLRAGIEAELGALGGGKPKNLVIVHLSKNHRRPGHLRTFPQPGSSDKDKRTNQRTSLGCPGTVCESRGEMPFFKGLKGASSKVLILAFFGFFWTPHLLNQAILS